MSPKIDYNNPATKPRFHSLRDAFSNMFQVVDLDPDPDGTERYSIKNIPVFKTYESRGHSCDVGYLDRMVHNFYLPIEAMRAIADDDVACKWGWKPKVHKHHTSEDPDSPNRPDVIGVVDNLYRVGNFLFADFSGLDKDALHDLRSNKYPDRSPEVDSRRARLLSVAVLGAEAPHFGFPQMRKFGFRGEVERHEQYDTFWSRFKESDLMPGTKEKLSPLSVQAHIMELPEDDPRRLFFEKHMGEQMGSAMSGGQYPGGMDVSAIESIVRNVIMQMTQQKFNQPEPTGGGMAMGQFSNQEMDKITSLLDLESSGGHHEQGGGKSVKEVEEGTKPHEGIPGMSSGTLPGDSGLTKRGQPSTSTTGGKAAEYDDEAKESGLTKSRLEGAISTVRHSLSKSENGEQLEAALTTITEYHSLIRDFSQKQASAIRHMQDRLASSDKESLKHSLREQLVRLRAERYIGVGDDERIDKHVEFLIDLPVEKHSAYIDQLKSVGKIPDSGVIRHSTGGSFSNDDLSARVEKHKARMAEDRDLREQTRLMGVNVEDIVMADLYQDMHSGEETESVIDDVF